VVSADLSLLEVCDIFASESSKSRRLLGKQESALHTNPLSREPAPCFPHSVDSSSYSALCFLAIGLWLTFAPHLSFGRFGRLPGDIHIKRDNFTFYFPITTCILVSLLLTLLFSILSRK
jgi:hypothetical protein